MQFKLIIDFKTAAALAFAVRPTLLPRAEAVIE
jgi:hypothetical protein